MILFVLPMKNHPEQKSHPVPFLRTEGRGFSWAQGDISMLKPRQNFCQGHLQQRVKTRGVTLPVATIIRVTPNITNRMGSRVFGFSYYYLLPVQKK